MSDNLMEDGAAEEVLERLEATWMRNVHLGIEAGRAQLRLAAIRMFENIGMNDAANAVRRVKVETFLTAGELELNL